jgi:hypothetical protein
MTVTTPHRYDLQDSFCINKEIQVYNRQLHKMSKDMYHVSIIDINLTKNEFTRHELYRNSSGKEKIAKIIGHKITNPLTRQYPPISLKWKEVPIATSIDEAMMKFISENADDLHKNAVGTSSRPKRTSITRNEDILWKMNSSNTVKLLLV